MGYADDLQAVSVDEALIDVSNQVADLKVQLSQRSNNPYAEDDEAERDFAKELGERIRREIKMETGCEG